VVLDGVAAQAKEEGTMSTARELVRLNIGIDQPERDQDAPCPSRAFLPGNPSGDCDTDGHYMCAECAHASRAAIAARHEL
jgi:hypothetical protein